MSDMYCHSVLSSFFPKNNRASGEAKEVRWT
jgi:hypothetical protein